MKQPLFVAAIALLLAGCGAGGTPRPGFVGVAPPRPSFPVTAGLDRVMGAGAGALVTLFGPPDADVIEGQGRKLQFGSRICVLDAYLYPRASGGAQAVTHIDTRQRDGSSIDRASCVAALVRREGGK